MKWGEGEGPPEGGGEHSRVRLGRLGSGMRSGVGSGVPRV